MYAITKTDKNGKRWIMAEFIFMYRKTAERVKRKKFNGDRSRVVRRIAIYVNGS